MDRQQRERCLKRAAAYRASGQTAQAWADANDVPMRAIASWCAHSRRWQERLDGVSVQASAPPQPAGFVAARVGSSLALASVRVEVNAEAARLELRWPLAHTRELAAWERELGR